MKTQEVIHYEENLKIGLVLKFTFILVFGTLIGVAALSFYTNEVVAWILLIVLIFIAILLFALVPRKYQILDDRLKIICGLLRINIPFDNIEVIETRPPSDIYGSGEAIRFGTGIGEKCILIERKHGMNILIQPMDTERFVEVLNNMMEKYKKGE